MKGERASERDGSWYGMRSRTILYDDQHVDLLVGLANRLSLQYESLIDTSIAKGLDGGFAGDSKRVSRCTCHV